MYRRSRRICASVLFFILTSLTIASAQSPLTAGGRVFIYDTGNKNAVIHSYMAPYKAAANLTHIIELKDRLVLVDMQFAKPFADEFRAYTDSLNKPIDRIYLSHEHPDHWMGSIAFQGVPVYALQETEDFLKAHGEAVLKAKNKPGMVPEIQKIIAPGTETIGGITFDISKVRDAESGAALVIALPQPKTLIAQDLLYSGTPLFLGNDQYTNWIDVLKGLRENYKDYEYFLPGHGAPASGPGIIDRNIGYLTKTNQAFAARGNDMDKIKTDILNAYPDLKGTFIVPFGLGMAFQRLQEHK